MSKKKYTLKEKLEPEPEPEMVDQEPETADHQPDLELEELSYTRIPKLSLSELKQIAKESKVRVTYIDENGKRKKKTKKQLKAELGL